MACKHFRVLLAPTAALGCTRCEPPKTLAVGTAGWLECVRFLFVVAIIAQRALRMFCEACAGQPTTLPPCSAANGRYSTIRITKAPINQSL